MKFSIGDKVVEKTSIRAHTNYTVDEVVGFLGDGILITIWGDGFGDEIERTDLFDDYGPGSRHWREGIQRVQESELFTPEEAIVELRRLEAVKDGLNSEFEAVRSNIREKLDAAADLVQEAADMAKPFKKDLYDLGRDECRKLYDAQENNGWRASHIRC